MACCAFVAFLFSQLYVLGRGLKRLLGRGSETDAHAPALWRLDSAAELALTPEAHPKRGSWKRAGVIVAVIAEIGIVAVGAHWLVVGDGAERVTAEVQHLTSGDGLAHLHHVFNR